MKKQIGFTLIELLIVVVILGIITAVAYPSYTNMVKKSKRKDAIYTLTDYANRMERYFSENNNYSITGFSDINVASTASENGLYVMSYRVTNDSFTLAATVDSTKDLASDTECKVFMINNLGQRTVTGSGTAKECWK